jgi:hypothetical protein
MSGMILMTFKPNFSNTKTALTSMLLLKGMKDQKILEDQRLNRSNTSLLLINFKTEPSNVLSVASQSW